MWGARPAFLLPKFAYFCYRSGFTSIVLPTVCQCPPLSVGNEQVRVEKKMDADHLWRVQFIYEKARETSFDLRMKKIIWDISSSF